MGTLKSYFFDKFKVNFGWFDSPKTVIAYKTFKVTGTLTKAMLYASVNQSAIHETYFNDKYAKWIKQSIEQDVTDVFVPKTTADGERADELRVKIGVSTFVPNTVELTAFVILTVEDGVPEETTPPTETTYPTDGILSAGFESLIQMMMLLMIMNFLMNIMGGIAGD